MIRTRPLLLNFNIGNAGGNTMAKKYETKDSGRRKDFDSGMRRDIQEGKPRFDLIMPPTLPYDEQLLTRVAMIFGRGAEKYGENNWQLANSVEELTRFKASAFRHFMQVMSGEEDEDHIAATVFNLNAIVYLMNKLGVDIHGNANSSE